MRSNPQELTGSRVRLRYEVDLHYEVAGPAEFILNVHAAKTRRQRVVDEQFSILPDVARRVDTQPVTGNRIATFSAQPGNFTIAYSALVDIDHRIVEPAAVTAESATELPADVLQFLYPSRYCQSDLVRQHAWDTFASLPRGYAQVRAVRAWVHRNVRFGVGTSCSTTTAIDTLRDGVGVCRDFAHTMIACCRALNYPARFLTGVDYGADPGLGPPDFHAYVEVYVGGAWYLFDPTGISPVTGLLRIGTGRDATDVAFATILGPVSAGMPRVRYSLIEDPVQGFVAPVATELAVSTAD